MKQVCPPHLAKLSNSRTQQTEYLLVGEMTDEADDDTEAIELLAADEMLLAAEDADDKTELAADVLPADDRLEADAEAAELMLDISEVALASTDDATLETSETAEETTELTPDTTLETTCACTDEANSTQIK